MMRRLFVLLVIHTGFVMVYSEKIESEENAADDNFSRPESYENSSSESKENASIGKDLQKYLSGFVPSEVTENWCPQNCEEGKVYENPNLSSYCICERAGDEVKTVRHNCSRNEIYNSLSGTCQELEGNGYPICVIQNKQCPDNEIGVRSHPNENLYKNYIVCLNGKVIVAQCNVMMHYNDTEKRCVQDSVKTTILSYSDCEEAPTIDCKKPQVTPIIEEHFKHHGNFTEIPDECRNCYYICSDRDVTSFDLTIECYRESTTQEMSTVESTSWTYTIGYTNYTVNPTTNEINSFHTPTPLEILTDQVYFSSQSSVTEQAFEIDYSSILSSLQTYLTTSSYSESQTAKTTTHTESLKEFDATVPTESISEITRPTTGNPEETTTNQMEEIQETQITDLIKDAIKETEQPVIKITESNELDSKATIQVTETVGTEIDISQGTDEGDLTEEAIKDLGIPTTIKSIHSETEEATTEATGEIVTVVTGFTTDRVFTEETTAGKTKGLELTDLKTETEMASTELEDSYTQTKEPLFGATASIEIDSKATVHTTGILPAEETTIVIETDKTDESDSIKDTIKDFEKQTTDFSSSVTSEIEKSTTEVTASQEHSSVATEHVTGSISAEQSAVSVMKEKTHGTEITELDTLSSLTYSQTDEPTSRATESNAIDKTTVQVIGAPVEESTTTIMDKTEEPTIGATVPPGSIYTISQQTTGHVLEEKTTAIETTEVTQGKEVTDLTKNSMEESEEPHFEGTTLYEISSKEAEQMTVSATGSTELNQIGSKGQTTENSFPEETTIDAEQTTEETEETTAGVSASGMEGVDLPKETIQNPGIRTTGFPSIYSETEEPAKISEITGQTTESIIVEETAINEIGSKITEKITENIVAGETTIDAETDSVIGQTDLKAETVREPEISIAISTETEEPTTGATETGQMTESTNELGPSTTAFSFSNTATVTTSTKLNEIGSQATEQTTQYVSGEETTDAVTEEDHLTENTVQDSGTATTSITGHDLTKPTTSSQTQEIEITDLTTNTTKETGVTVTNKIDSKGTEQTAIFSTEGNTVGAVTVQGTVDADLPNENIQDPGISSSGFPNTYTESTKGTTEFTESISTLTGQMTENILVEKTSTSKWEDIQGTEISDKTRGTIKELGLSTTPSSFSYFETKEPLTENTALNEIDSRATGHTTKKIMAEETTIAAATTSKVAEGGLSINSETEEPTGATTSISAVTGQVTENILVEETTISKTVEITDITSDSIEELGLPTTGLSFSYSQVEEVATSGIALSEISSKTTAQTTETILAEETTIGVEIGSGTGEADLSEERVKDTGTAITDSLSIYSETEESSIDTVKETGLPITTILNEISTEEVDLSEETVKETGLPITTILNEISHEEVDLSEETVKEPGIATTDFSNIDSETEELTIDSTKELGLPTTTFLFSSSKTEESVTTNTILNEIGAEATGQTTETISAEETTIGVAIGSVTEEVDLSEETVKEVGLPITTILNEISDEATGHTKETTIGVAIGSVTEEVDLSEETVKEPGIATTDFSNIDSETEELTIDSTKELGLPTTTFLFSSSKTEESVTANTILNEIGAEATGQTTETMSAEETTIGVAIGSVTEEVDLSEETVKEIGLPITTILNEISDEATGQTKETTIGVAIGSVTEEVDLSEETVKEPGIATTDFSNIDSETEELTIDSTKELGLPTTTFLFSSSKTEEPVTISTILNEIGAEATEQTTETIAVEKTSIGVAIVSVTEEVDLSEEIVKEPDIATTDFSNIDSETEELTIDTKESGLPTTTSSFSSSKTEKPVIPSTTLNEIGAEATEQATETILVEETTDAVTTSITEDLTEEIIQDFSETKEPTINNMKESKLPTTDFSFSHPETEKPSTEYTEVDEIISGETTKNDLIAETTIGAITVSVIDEATELPTSGSVALTSQTTGNALTEEFTPDLITPLSFNDPQTEKSPTAFNEIGLPSTEQMTATDVSVEATVIETGTNKTPEKDIADLTKETTKYSGLSTTGFPSIYSETEEPTTGATVPVGSVSAVTEEMIGSILVEETTASKTIDGMEIDYKVTGQMTEASSYSDSQAEKLATRATESNENGSTASEHMTGSVLVEETTIGMGTDKTPEADDADLSKETIKDLVMPTTDFASTYSDTEGPIIEDTILPGSISVVTRQTTESVLAEETIEETSKIMKQTTGTEITDLTKYNVKTKIPTTDFSIYSEEPTTGATELGQMGSTELTEQTIGRVLTEEYTKTTGTEVPDLVSSLSFSYSQTEKQPTEVTTVIGSISTEQTGTISIKESTIALGTSETVTVEESTTTILKEIGSEATGQVTEIYSVEETTMDTLIDKTRGTDEADLTKETTNDLGVSTKGFPSIYSETKEPTGVVEELTTAVTTIENEIGSVVTRQVTGSMSKEESAPESITMETDGTEIINLTKETIKASGPTITNLPFNYPQTDEALIGATTSSEMSSKPAEQATETVSVVKSFTDKTMENTQETELADLTKDAIKATGQLTTAKTIGQITDLYVEVAVSTGTDKTQDEINSTEDTIKDSGIQTTSFPTIYSETDELTTGVTALQQTGSVVTEVATESILAEEITSEETMKRTETKSIDLTKETIKESGLTTTPLPFYYSQTEETSMGKTASNEMSSKVTEQVTVTVLAAEIFTDKTIEHTEGTKMAEERTKVAGQMTETTSVQGTTVVDSEIGDNNLMETSQDNEMPTKGATVTPETIFTTGHTIGTVLVEETTTGKAMEETGGIEITDLTKDAARETGLESVSVAETTVEMGTDKIPGSIVADLTQGTEDFGMPTTGSASIYSETEEPTMGGETTGRTSEENTVSTIMKKTPSADIDDDDDIKETNIEIGLSTVLPIKYFKTEEPATGATVPSERETASTSDETEPEPISSTDFTTNISTFVMPVKPLCPVTGDQGQQCTKEGCYRYNSSCTLYYNCYYSEPCGRIIASDIKECPKCLKFNAQQKTCDIAENVPECTYYRRSHPSHLKNNRPSQNRMCTGPGKFVVPENRARYYDCIYESDKNKYLLTVKRCPRNEEFDDVTKYCKKKTRCGKDMGCSRFHNVASTCEKNRYAYDRYDCQKFYHCHHGVPAVPLFCPAEYVFNGKFCQSEKHSFIDYCNSISNITSKHKTNQ